MKITFTDKNVNIPNRIYSYTEQKFNELDRFFRSEPEAAAVFSVENGKHILEATVTSAPPSSVWWRAPPICSSP